jgi:hypothetical protein
MQFVRNKDGINNHECQSRIKIGEAIVGLIKSNVFINVAEFLLLRWS